MLRARVIDRKIKSFDQKRHLFGFGLGSKKRFVPPNFYETGRHQPPRPPGEYAPSAPTGAVVKDNRNGVPDTYWKVFNTYFSRFLTIVVEFEVNHIPAEGPVHMEWVGTFLRKMTYHEACLILGIHPDTELTSDLLDDCMKCMVQNNHPDMGGAPLIQKKMVEAHQLLLDHLEVIEKGEDPPTYPYQYQLNPRDVLDVSPDHRFRAYNPFKDPDRKDAAQLASIKKKFDEEEAEEPEGELGKVKKVKEKEKDKKDDAINPGEKGGKEKETQEEKDKKKKKKKSFEEEQVFRMPNLMQEEEEMAQFENEQDLSVYDKKRLPGETQLQFEARMFTMELSRKQAEIQERFLSGGPNDVLHFYPPHVSPTKPIYVDGLMMWPGNPDTFNHFHGDTVEDDPIALAHRGIRGINYRFDDHRYGVGEFGEKIDPFYIHTGQIPHPTENKKEWWEYINFEMPKRRAEFTELVKKMDPEWNFTLSGRYEVERRWTKEQEYHDNYDRISNKIKRDLEEVAAYQDPETRDAFIKQRKEENALLTKLYDRNYALRGSAFEPLAILEGKHVFEVEDPHAYGRTNPEWRDLTGMTNKRLSRRGNMSTKVLDEELDEDVQKLHPFDKMRVKMRLKLMPKSFIVETTPRWGNPFIGKEKPAYDLPFEDENPGAARTLRHFIPIKKDDLWCDDRAVQMMEEMEIQAEEDEKLFEAVGAEEASKIIFKRDYLEPYMIETTEEHIRLAAVAVTMELFKNRDVSKMTMQETIQLAKPLINILQPTTRAIIEEESLMFKYMPEDAREEEAMELKAWLIDHELWGEEKVDETLQNWFKLRDEKWLQQKKAEWDYLHLIEDMRGAFASGEDDLKRMDGYDETDIRKRDSPWKRTGGLQDVDYFPFTKDRLTDIKRNQRKQALLSKVEQLKYERDRLFKKAFWRKMRAAAMPVRALSDHERKFLTPEAQKLMDAEFLQYKQAERDLTTDYNRAELKYRTAYFDVIREDMEEAAISADYPSCEEEVSDDFDFNALVGHEKPKPPVLTQEEADTVPFDEKMLVISDQTLLDDMELAVYRDFMVQIDVAKEKKRLDIIPQIEERLGEDHIKVIRQPKQDVMDVLEAPENMPYMNLNKRKLMLEQLNLRQLTAWEEAEGIYRETEAERGIVGYDGINHLLNRDAYDYHYTLPTKEEQAVMDKPNDPNIDVEYLDWVLADYLAIRSDPVAAAEHKKRQVARINMLDEIEKERDERAYREVDDYVANARELRRMKEEEASLLKSIERTAEAEKMDAQEKNDLIAEKMESLREKYAEKIAKRKAEFDRDDALRVVEKNNWAKMEEMGLISKEKREKKEKRELEDREYRQKKAMEQLNFKKKEEEKKEEEKVVEMVEKQEKQEKEEKKEKKDKK
ncbi:hypothetical protein PROFUN_03079 [Planoprotostelium fungivorum]|uniref:Uncharacterized protein n=1 Tax=Planoprotostelium fungivorum TaxID=1890364 RepID=A0A2P6NQ64_9EUKA|nr:hypothetical protein PROFUN_03079 [Planoprotostelium fungivorum]